MAGGSPKGQICEHYTRFCLLQAECCKKFYPCRFCHDEDSDHDMDRHKVQNIQCVKCNTIQPVAKSCRNCQTVFGEYFCPICRLYDVNRNQFHCEKCGICRIGPKEKFYHCERCNLCLDKELKGYHKCHEDVAKSSCPVCFEFLHTSRTAMKVLQCGHMIHSDCLERSFKQGHYQCPLCKESLIDMSEVWKQMDAACASVQLPEELRHITVKILCQDCHKNSEPVFNTVGLKCKHCGGYNTAKV